MYGAIETGGTKFVCGIGNEKGDIIERISVPTTTPEGTLEKAVSFFRGRQITSVGVGTFGPVDLNAGSDTYGFITSTPKKGWSNFDLLGVLKQSLAIPVHLDTDVNAAALGESVWGAAKGLDSCLYITVGTGIGAGAVVEGRPLKGLSHPEMGHIRLPRHPDDNFRGSCPYHGDCLEGMASGPAIEVRWGNEAANLTGNQEVWEVESYYLANAVANYILILSPKKVIMGGGVMKQTQLFPLIRTKVQAILNGYVELNQKVEDYIVPPGLGDNAGLAGALALAMKKTQPF